jgi:molybdopterin/thiamine biosynthesis adenylyltransferase
MENTSSYPGRHIYLGEVKKLQEENKLSVNPDNSISTYMNGETKAFHRNQVFPRSKETTEGLLEDLTPGTQLAGNFQTEIWPLYEKSISENPVLPLFGELFYYPDLDHIVTYLPQKWHHIALVARNSLLIRDTNQSISWADQRRLFENITVGVAGASVGKNIFLRAIDTLRPLKIKIGDPRKYKDTNSQRTDLSYWEIGQNKAIVAAKQVHRNDPYCQIFVYSEGLRSENIDTFLAGSKDEPKLDFLIEETDDPDIKIKLRQEARKRQIPVFMITDIGSSYQIDFRDFKQQPDLSLANNISDEDLIGAQNKWHKDRANRELFFDFAFKIIGDYWKEVPEFHDLVLKKISVPFGGGIPQLGLAAQAGGSHLSLLLAQKILGEEIPGRIFANLRKLEIKTEL